MDFIEDLVEMIFCCYCCDNDIKYKIKYEKVSSNSEEKPTCSICLEEYNKKDVIWKIQCGHIYHKKCIIEWTDKKLICPLCRENLTNQLLI